VISSSPTKLAETARSTPYSLQALFLIWNTCRKIRGTHDFFHGIESFACLIRFDKRGTSLSDRSVGFPTLDERIDDIRVVMDAAGSKRAVLLGVSEGGAMIQAHLVLRSAPACTQAKSRSARTTTLAESPSISHLVLVILPIAVRFWFPVRSTIWLRDLV
jgi:pimeloyl-ACP methyl ester carboxylesterase